MDEQIDYSDYGHVPESIDYTQYGHEGSAENLLGQMQQGVQDQEPQFKTVKTFLGEIPDINDPEVKKYVEKQFGPPNAESMKRIAGMALPLVAPEIKAVPYVSKLLSRVPLGSAVGNALGRIGYGTALNTAPELFSKEGRANISENALKNLLWNTVIEGITTPFRIARSYAELTNPIKYTEQKAAQINSERNATKAMMDEKYRPINEKYNDYNVTLTPKKYMTESGIKRNQLFPDAKLSYDKFINEPTFGNLHNLKSKVGSDWARISSHPATTEKAQLFAQMRDNLEKKAHQFLSHDGNALNQYENATEYAKNNYFPYLSTPTLRDISKSKDIKELDLTPNNMARSLKIAMKKTVGSGTGERSLIPESHPLRRHYSDLKSRINRGKLASSTLPVVGGALAGEFLHPGVGGILSGAGAGLGSSGLGALLSKFGANTLTSSVLQNPMVENALLKLSSPYYRGARSMENYLTGGSE